MEEPPAKEKTMDVDGKRDDKKAKKNKLISVVLPVILIILVSFGCGFGLCFLVFPSSSTSPTVASNHADANSNHPSSVERTPEGGTGSSDGTSTTTALTSVPTSKTCPNLASLHRVPIKDLPVPTFEIVSSMLEINIWKLHPIVAYHLSSVSFVLDVLKETSVLYLNCIVHKVVKVQMKEGNGSLITEIQESLHDKKRELLTISLPQVTRGGLITLEISFYPSFDTFERTSFPCGSTTCSVFVLKGLGLMVPHFDTSLKHTWTVKVGHTSGVEVLANTRKNSTSSTTSTTFLETAPILPNELSIVIVENFAKQVSGTQVEYYLPNGTDVKKTTGMIGTLGNVLATKAKPSIPTGEMFFFIVIPAMENYQFCGRNVALVGTSLLRSNTEIQQDFMWNFIFRTVIYDKVTPADKKSSWVYEQSALFLSTSIKSTNKNLWKKHYYEIVMNNGRDDMKALVNQSIVYEDERRYLEKRHHVAKVSTILAMFVSVNNDTSTDPLTILDTVRSNATSSQFFFIKSQLKIGNGAPVDVDRVISCYVDTPVTPRLHINRTSPTHVAIRRSSGGPTDGCDMLLWLEKGQKMGTTVNKEHKVLSGTVEKMEVESNSPVLLSGETPFSAYGYTMEQSEFDRLLDVSVVNSYDESSLKMLAFNAFNASAEGILSYESVKTFIKLLFSQKVLTVDEAVDLWMEPVIQSRNVEMTNLTEKIIASVLNITGQPSDDSIVPNYIVDRFDKSLQNSSKFEIEKTTRLIIRCGESCYLPTMTKYMASVYCVIDGDADCSYNPHILDMYVCVAVAKGRETDYTMYGNIYNKCIGKTCHQSTLSGLLCSPDTTNLQYWLQLSFTMDTTDRINRQIVLTIFKGLVFNEVSRPVMFSYFLENWHLIHQKFSNNPALLGEIIEILSSTMYTSDELTQFQQFVAFYGENLAMYREFEEQAEKAKKVVEWNEKYSKDFIQMFT